MKIILTKKEVEYLTDMCEIFDTMCNGLSSSTKKHIDKSLELFPNDTDRWGSMRTTDEGTEIYITEGVMKHITQIYGNISTKIGSLIESIVALGIFTENTMKEFSVKWFKKNFIRPKVIYDKDITADDIELVGHSIRQAWRIETYSENEIRVFRDDSHFFIFSSDKKLIRRIRYDIDVNDKIIDFVINKKIDDEPIDKNTIIDEAMSSFYMTCSDMIKHIQCVLS